MSKLINTAFIVIITTLGFTTTTQAALIVVNDSVFGPASVLRDTTNQIDYLRLDFTMGYGYNGIIAETGTGGDFEGWGVASVADMDALGISAGISGGSTDPAQISIAENLRDWFCPVGTCVNSSSTHEYARGLVSDAGPDYQSGAPSLLAFTIGRRFNVNPDEVDFRVSGHGGYDHTNEEIWMVRTSPVPVPAAVWLFGSGLIGLTAFARRRLSS